MQNKPMGKKVAVTSIIFCVIIIVGIVLSAVVGVNTKDVTVRNAVLTFEGSVKSSDFSTALKEELGEEAVIVVNEIPAVPEAAAEGEDEETATTTTTTAASGTLTSGRIVVTLSGIDSKSDEDIKTAFATVFEKDAYKNNNLAVESVESVKKLASFEPIQAYLCIIVLLIAFIYCLIRFSASGSLAAGVSVVVASVISAAVTVCASLICGVFAGSNISVAAGATVIITFIFTHIVIDALLTENKCVTSTVWSVSGIIIFLLAVFAIFGIIAGDAAVIGYAVPAIFAAVFSAISALVYGKAVWLSMKKEKTVGKKKKKAVIK